MYNISYIIRLRYIIDYIYYVIYIILYNTSYDIKPFKTNGELVLRGPSLARCWGGLRGLREGADEYVVVFYVF